MLIGLSVKAFLTIGKHVLKGLVATNLTADRRFKVPTNGEFGATFFDKTQISRGRKKSYHKYGTEEVIQVCQCNIALKLLLCHGNEAGNKQNNQVCFAKRKTW